MSGCGLCDVCAFQNKMVESLSKEPSARLLKHVVRCYLRLTDHHRLVPSNFNGSSFLIFKIFALHFSNDVILYAAIFSFLCYF